ncbi:hypothetical protein ACWEOE_05860 [Amycolatopsis sp. NPDC004368]
MDALAGQGLTTLRVILGFTLLTTTFHYSHNVIREQDYPQITGLPVLVAQIVIAFGWVLFTASGLAGYRAYVRGRYWRALGFLLVCSLGGLASAGHFLVGVPRIPAFWFATIFTDAAAAMALWFFVSWAASKLNRVSAGDQAST